MANKQEQSLYLQPTNLSDRKEAPNASNSKRSARTVNACEQCQRRKTKCSGLPGPCEACITTGYFCRFQRPSGFKSRPTVTYSAEDKRLQYLLNAVLCAIKYSDEADLSAMVAALRQNATPEEVALHLRRNFKLLQEQDHVPTVPVEDSDLFLLASRICVNDESEISSNSASAITDAIQFTESQQFAPSGFQSRRLPSDGFQFPANAQDMGLATTSLANENVQMGFAPQALFDSLTWGLSYPNSVMPMNSTTSGTQPGLEQTMFTPISMYETQRRQQYQQLADVASLTDDMHQSLPQQDFQTHTLPITSSVPSWLTPAYDSHRFTDAWTEEPAILVPEDFSMQEDPTQLQNHLREQRPQTFTMQYPAGSTGQPTGQPTGQSTGQSTRQSTRQPPAGA